MSCIGYLEESTEGTSLIDANSTVTQFGIQGEFDRQHPWGKQEIAEILQENSKSPVDLVPGMKSVNIKHQFIYQHGDEWYYLLGKKVHVSGTGATNLDRITLGTLSANPIKSRTVYSRVTNPATSDYVKATGCKTASFAVHLESSLPGQKPKPIWCDLELWGWTTSTSLALNNAPSYPSGLVNTASKSIEDMTLIKMDNSAGTATTLANLQEITIGGKNTLAYHGGLLSNTPRGIQQLEGTKIWIEGLATMDFTTDDMLARARYDFANTFAPGTAHTFQFQVAFAGTPSAPDNYHLITLENVMVHSLTQTVYKNKVPAFTFMGTCMADGTNEPITIDLKDGVEYQA